MSLSDMAELESLINQIPQYHTVATKAEVFFLYELSMKTEGDGAIVEIGTNIGLSAIALALAQKHKGGRPITSIDIWEHPNIAKHLEMAGLSDYVQRIVGESAHIASSWDKDIDLLWLDGDHSYIGTRTDIVKWSKFLKNGGILGLHDYPVIGGVHKAAQKHLFGDPLQWRVHSDRLASRILLFEKLDKQVKTRTLKSWLTRQCYWQYRLWRYLLFRIFPQSASKLIHVLKYKSITENPSEK